MEQRDSEEIVRKYYNTRQHIEAYRNTGLIVCEQQIFDMFLRPTDRVLDIGCFVGRVSFALAKRCGFVLGVDIAEDGIMQAREKKRAEGFENCDFQIASAQELPADDGSFDVTLLAYNSLECMPGKKQRESALAECFRVLKPGGHAVLSVHNRWHSRYLRVLAVYDTVRLIYRLHHRLGSMLLRQLQKHWTFLHPDMLTHERHTIFEQMAGSVAVCPVYFYSRSEIKRQLRSMGFRDIRIFQIDAQDPYTQQGRSAAVRSRPRPSFFVPGYYIVATK